MPLRAARCPRPDAMPMVLMVAHAVMLAAVLAGCPVFCAAQDSSTQARLLRTAIGIRPHSATAGFAYHGLPGRIFGTDVLFLLPHALDSRRLALPTSATTTIQGKSGEALVIQPSVTTVDAYRMLHEIEQRALADIRSLVEGLKQDQASTMPPGIIRRVTGGDVAHVMMRVSLARFGPLEPDQQLYYLVVGIDTYAPNTLRGFSSGINWPLRSELVYTIDGWQSLLEVMYARTPD